VAILTGTTPYAGTIQGRFRWATGGDWKDVIPPSGSNPGTRPNGGGTIPNSQIQWHCVNPGGGSGEPCPPLTSGQSTEQCLLVELSQRSPPAIGAKFIHDSAYKCFTIIDGQADAGLVDDRAKGILPPREIARTLLPLLPLAQKTRRPRFGFALFELTQRAPEDFASSPEAPAENAVRENAGRHRGHVRSESGPEAIWP
jgi:hypothetical protein